MSRWQMNSVDGASYRLSRRLRTQRSDSHGGTYGGSLQLPFNNQRQLPSFAAVDAYVAEIAINSLLLARVQCSL